MPAFFSHPDYTVGFGITPNLQTLAGSPTKGLDYRRWGLAPRLEDSYMYLIPPTLYASCLLLSIHRLLGLGFSSFLCYH